MHAAIVNEWGQPPVYSSFDLSQPTQTQNRVKVLAAGLHNLVRSRATGKHFTVASKSPPHIPGTDGVGIVTGTDDLVYFNCLSAVTGSFADEINVEKEDCFRLPEGADPDTIAVLTNPAMSSWMALSARAGNDPGQSFSVAIVGATGVSGQTAVQICKAFGASEIIAIGKPGQKLERTVEMGATKTINLASNLVETDFSAAANVDVVLDYLWGSVAEKAIPGIVAKRANPSQRLTWVEIGALGGDGCTISAALTRKANVAFVGCGPGSWTFPELNAEMPKMLKAIVDWKLQTAFEVRKLEDVNGWWDAIGGARLVVKP